MRKQPVFATDDEHDRILKPLGVVESHQSDERFIVLATVGVGYERNLLKEEIKAVVLCFGGCVELPRHLNEFLKVLKSARRFDCALVLKPLDVSALVNYGVEQVADRYALLVALAQPFHRLHEATERLDGRLPQPRHRFRLGCRIPDA